MQILVPEALSDQTAAQIFVSSSATCPNAIMPCMYSIMHSKMCHLLCGYPVSLMQYAQGLGLLSMLLPLVSLDSEFIASSIHEFCSG